MVEDSKLVDQHVVEDFTEIDRLERSWSSYLWFERYRQLPIRHPRHFHHTTVQRTVSTKCNHNTQHADTRSVGECMGNGHTIMCFETISNHSERFSSLSNAKIKHRQSVTSKLFFRGPHARPKLFTPILTFKGG